jgi:predicted nucleotidyltransferase
MLDLLGKSKIRKRILLLFLYNQSQSYYIRQIARIVNTSGGTAQRELQRLVAHDLLVSTRQGNQRMYSLNRSNHVLPEIESIVARTIGIEHALAEAICTVPGIEFAFIFGSFAKDAFRSDSDIDLFVLGEVNEDILHQQCLHVEETVCHEINYHVSSVAEFSKDFRGSLFLQNSIADHVLVCGDEKKFKQLIT